MYNRYIPQSDGTYRRSRIPDPAVPPEPKPPAPPPEPQVPSPPPRPHPGPPPPPRRRPRPQTRRESSGDSPLAFLRQLLPRDFDTGDLLVVVLLLLMTGDCQEDQNTALLTLALYLFL